MRTLRGGLCVGHKHVYEGRARGPFKMSAEQGSWLRMVQGFGYCLQQGQVGADRRSGSS